MTEVMSRSVGRARFFLVLLAVFAGVAMVLAVTGLYRRHELHRGQCALASWESARHSAAHRGARSRPCSAGAFAWWRSALSSAWPLRSLWTRLLSTLLYGVSPLDLATWASVPPVLAVAAVLAILIPARRAATLAPIIAMREE